MQNFHQFAEQVIQSSDKCILFTDLDNCVSMVNPPCLAWLNCDSVEQLIGANLKDLNANPSLRELLDASLAERPTCDEMIETEVAATLDGISGTLAFRRVCIQGTDGEPQGYAYVFSLITDSETSAFDKIMINNLMRNSPDLIYFKDLDSCFTQLSQSLVQRLGAETMEEVIGKSDFDFWGNQSAKEFYNTEQEIIRSRQPIAKTESAVRPNGEVAWSLMSKMPLIDDHGQVVGTFGINKDITLQKKFEEELDKTHKELVFASRQAGMAEIATNILHNVGNVLNSINVSISQADELSRRLKIKNLEKVATMITENAGVENYLVEDEKGKRIPEYLGMIARELAKDQKEVIEELEATKRHLEHIKVVVSMQQEYATANQVVENVDLAEVLEDAIRMSSGSLERHRIKLIREFEPGLTMSLDKHRVMQILVNLIRNAKHAMKATQRHDNLLTITVDEKQAGMVSISIKDNGMGISAENLTNLFNHGFTTKKDGHGFGLHSGFGKHQRGFNSSGTQHSHHGYSWLRTNQCLADVVPNQFGQLLCQNTGKHPRHQSSTSRPSDGPDPIGIHEPLIG